MFANTKTEDITPKQEYIQPKTTDILEYLVNGQEVSDKNYWHLMGKLPGVSIIVNKCISALYCYADNAILVEEINSIEHVKTAYFTSSIPSI